VGSLESRVLVTARRFPGLGVGDGGKELAELEPVLATPRLPQAPELVADEDEIAAVAGISIVGSGGRPGLEALPGGVGRDVFRNVMPQG
jgi:hypothetical protein